MKRAVCGLGISVFVVLLSAGDASAGGPWDHSGSMVGRFGSALEACKDQYGTGAAYEVVEAAPPNGDANGNAHCMVREKGNPSGAKLDNGVVYKVPGQASPPTPTPCDASSDFSWFPTLSKSRLRGAASGDAGEVAPDSKPASCNNGTDSAGTKMFVNSKGKVRADRMQKVAIPNHYHLKVGDLVVDPTLFQFFATKNDFKGLVFTGTEAQLESTLDRLVKQCGPTQDSSLKAAVAGKSGKELKAQGWDNAKVFNTGQSLKLRRGGKSADYP